MAAVCIASPLRAQELGITTRATGGFDSNPTFAATPENRRGAPTGRVDADGFARAELAVRSTIGAAPWLGAALDADVRVYGRGDVRAWERLRISGGTRAGRFSPALHLEGARYDASHTEDAAWTGRIRAALDVRLTEGLSLGVDAVGGARSYDTGGQQDGLLGGELRVTGVLDPIELATGMDFERRGSSDPLAERIEIAPWLAARLRLGRLRAEAQYALFIRVFDEPFRDGVEHVGRLGGSIEVVTWLRATVGVEIGIARGDPDSLIYDRFEALAGVEVVFESPRTPAEPVTPEPTRSGPITLRFVFPEAHEVHVVATFNDWDAARGVLRPVGDGAFEAAFDVPPGHHRYHLLVDGEPTRPPGAELYVSDDLGGEDAVLVVP